METTAKPKTDALKKFAFRDLGVWEKVCIIVMQVWLFLKKAVFLVDNYFYVLP
jgi:hypothetical protein